MTVPQDDQVRLIKPQPCLNPNLPPGTQHIQLSPISLVAWSAFPSVLAFEQELALDRLGAAIAELAGWYPVLAGRYVSRQRPSADLSDYAIELTGSPVPLHTATHDLDGPEAFPTANVIQPSLAPYVPSLGPSMSAVDSGEHLVAFKHTVVLPSRRSVLGLMISHTLADGASCSKLLHDLTYLYTHPGSSLPQPPHFFAKVIYPEWPPSNETKQRFKTNLLVPTALPEVFEKFSAAAEASEPVYLELSMGEVAAIRKQVQGNTGAFVSDQDALSGWWIEFLERLGEERIKTATYIVNYRNLYPGRSSFPAELKNQYSTVAQVRDIDIDTSNNAAGLERMSSVASDIRAEIERFKADPDYGLKWLSNAAYWHEVTATEGKSFNYIPPPGVAIINSNMRYDWTPDFGIGPSRYHTAFCARRFLRVFRQNALGPDGSPNGIELAFAVEKGQGQRAHELLAEDRRRWESVFPS